MRSAAASAISCQFVLSRITKYAMLYMAVAIKIAVKRPETPKSQTKANMAASGKPISQKQATAK